MEPYFESVGTNNYRGTLTPTTTVSVAYIRELVAITRNYRRNGYTIAPRNMIIGSDATITLSNLKACEMSTTNRRKLTQEERGQLRQLAQQEQMDVEEVTSQYMRYLNSGE